ncbi:CBS domain-containing protein [Paraburkholderia sp. UYCP14C]|uniref:CBS domain-containing protein n=1 Tax=Paraburkholderia sp. UYCP14C TaxID=2511130 RepID=UPI00101EB451|nr:CBS domain-containing protein [Paraburkholderia sp. UYCP14C]RZF24526.1 CBS domain-containing protein [Paraburkholderia sp. UYCP14C]
MRVDECYSRGTVHIPVSCNLQEAARQMASQHVGALIVTDDVMPGEMVGVITDRDIVLKAAAFGKSPNEMAVGEVMTKGVAMVNEMADLDDAMQVMSSQGVRRLAVVRDDASIVGILSLDDVIDAFGRDWSLLTGILRSELNREKIGSVQAPLHV